MKKGRARLRMSKKNSIFAAGLKMEGELKIEN